LRIDPSTILPNHIGTENVIDNRGEKVKRFFSTIRISSHRSLRILHLHGLVRPHRRALQLHLHRVHSHPRPSPSTVILDPHPRSSLPLSSLYSYSPSILTLTYKTISSRIKLYINWPYKHPLNLPLSSCTRST
jgi:hypothetical protein